MSAQWSMRLLTLMRTPLRIITSLIKINGSQTSCSNHSSKLTWENLLEKPLSTTKFCHGREIHWLKRDLSLKLRDTLLDLQSEGETQTTKHGMMKTICQRLKEPGRRLIFKVLIWLNTLKTNQTTMS